MSKLHTITRYVEEKRTSFTVSRLIMMTGVKLREYTPSSLDDVNALKKVEQALPALLEPRELEELKHLLLKA
ncbi:MAG: hypothetical protein AB2A00_01230 [Myxococcota bacterium]